MYKKTSFDSSEAQQTLASLEGKYVLAEGTDVADANDMLEKVIFSLNIHEGAPKYVLTRAMYPEKGPLEEARFVVRPASNAALGVSKMKRMFTLLADEKFFDKFIKEMAIWFDEYAYYAKLDENVKELNEKVSALATEAEIPFDVRFTVGTGVDDVSDDSITIGLATDTVLDLSTLPLFDENFEGRVEKYNEMIVDTLRACAKPWDIFKTKTTFTKDLGICSRRSVIKLIRKVVNRNLKFVRVGTGYVDADNYFAVISKTAVTPEEAEVLEGALIVDNDAISKIESKTGKTKIAIEFKVSPIDEDGKSVDVSLEDALADASRD